MWYPVCQGFLPLFCVRLDLCDSRLGISHGQSQPGSKGTLGIAVTEPVWWIPLCWQIEAFVCRTLHGGKAGEGAVTMWHEIREGSSVWRRFSWGFSSRLQAYRSAIAISYASSCCYLLHAGINIMFSWHVKLHSPTDSSKESCREDCKVLVKILFIEWSHNGVCRG